ncbi:hypothetical protein ABBQ38_009631 [Trebouxia sp. C0009 RCD-2024]
MCTSLFLWNTHPTILFLVALNRDEFFARPTQAAHFWSDWPSLLAGRDTQGGGTWLGVTTNGRFAMLTNFREVAYDAVKNAPSRGALTTNFLQSNIEPMQYLQSLHEKAYNGFNLVVGDFRKQKLAYFSNRANRPAYELEPGLYGISNGVLESSWPKVEQGKAQLRWFLEQAIDTEQLDPDMLLHHVMSNTAKVQQLQELPQTGMPVEIERLMSSIFIEPCELKGAAYGTRSQTVLIVHRNGRAQLHERSGPDMDCKSQNCALDNDWVCVQQSFDWS